jgi:uncharacterized protein
MKYLLVIVVVGVMLWLMFGRDRVAGPAKRRAPDPPAAPESRVACAHCGVHLPRSDTVADPTGRLYCGNAHRLAGPR